jgi:pimeloyl-ACP methyl ester carboxylesterase
VSGPLHWRRIGAGPGLAVAFHCALAHGGEWTAVGARLPGVALAAPDLTGHGKSPDWDGRGDFHARATLDAGALVEEIGQGAALDLIGHSFGATVALRLALERPDLVRSLVLIEPVLFAAARDGAPEIFAAHLARAAPFRAALAAGDTTGAARLFHAEWGQGRHDDLPPHQRDYVERRIGLVATQDPALLADAAGMLAEGRLERLARPVLLLEGSASPPVIGAIAAELARRLPQVRRQHVAGAAHMLPLTHPDAVAAAVAAHLARL